MPRVTGFAVSLNVLRTGLPTFKPAEIAGRARDGVLLVLVVEGLDEYHEQLAARISWA